MVPPNDSANQSLRRVRLAELQALNPDAIRAQIDRIRKSHHLSKAAQHFEKHREEFAGLGVSDVHGYLAWMILHLRKPNTRVYTFITTKVTRHRMWAIADVDTGMIAQYNETRDRLWSFYRHPFASVFIRTITPLWIEVVDTGWEIELR